jgi:ATP synthase protein I
MSSSRESREEAIKRLNERASSLEASTAEAASDDAAGHAAASQAWRILGELIGGVLVGLALGIVFDRFAGTVPWGTISGVLLGFAVSIWMAWRTASRIAARAKLEGEPKSVPFDDEDELGV